MSEKINNNEILFEKNKIPPIFQFINLENFDYSFSISKQIFDPISISFKTLENEEIDKKNIKKKEKSVISTQTSNSKNLDKKTKQAIKKNKQKLKKKEEEKAEELKLAKQDSKNGIYSIKLTKEDKKKKEKEKKQKINLIKQQQINNEKIKNQIIKNTFNMIETFINEKNNINENENDKKQNENKNKKKKNKNNKKNENKDLNNEIKNEIENNKKVDDFIKSIKAKKENEKKENSKENLKMNFFNKYKYLFILDPTFRLKLRNIENSIDEEIINDLFSMIKKSNILEKEILKDSCVLIDSLNEIIYSNLNENLLKNFISNNINLINEFSNQIENENENYFILICNILYSLIKLKNELNKEIEINIENLFEIIIENIKKNLNEFKDFNIKSNNFLINNLLLYFLIRIFKNDKNEIIENLLNKFLENIINNFNIKEENLEKFKILFFNVKFILKLFNIFETKKEKFYSLNIKTTKFIENNFNLIQEKIFKLNSKKYLNIIFYVIKIYIFNMDLYYYLETNLFEDFFNLLKIVTEKEPFINEFEEKKLFFKDFELNTLSFNSDDGISNYCMILMKIFKFFDKENFDEKIYIEYFKKIIEIVLDIKQKYLFDKYLQLLSRELNNKINIKISNEIFNFILNKILNIQKNIKEIKILKEFIQFYKKFDLIKNNVINYIKNVDNSEIKEQINILFLLSFFNKNDKKIDELINNIEFNKICFLKIDIINFLLHFYVNDEINNLNEII